MAPGSQGGAAPPRVDLKVDGRTVSVPEDATLLDALREHAAARSVKDGCSPQGQCGCCTVLVDGAPRVACVTPVRRVAGRAITTAAGLPESDRRRWADAFCATGASQCGFCTPGIVVRFAGLRDRGVAATDEDAAGRALLAHLCRCTGWRTILDAWRSYDEGVDQSGRDLVAASRRAAIEGGGPQLVGPDVAMGLGGFADDTAPPDALVAVPDGRGGWAVGETLADARAVAGKIQGRRSPAGIRHPLDVPAGDWDATLRTTWVEPAYLELDASWCEPGGEPHTPLANGGAFGGKRDSVVMAAARRFADECGRTVRVLLSREDTVRLGPKRPPVAGGVHADGRGVLRVVRTPGIAEAVASVAPGIEVQEVEVAGPPTSTALRAAGWAEALVLLAGAGGATAVEVDRPTGWVRVAAPGGGRAEARCGTDRIEVRVTAGEPLDETVLRSYCVGAAHMGHSWVRSEGIAVDAAGVVHDLTVRSFGVLRAVDMPPVHVDIENADGGPVNGSDAVFVAVAAASWIAQGCPPDWPTHRR